MMNDLHHRPSGMMCAGCERRNIDCSHLNFKEMRKIREDKDGTVVVRCVEYRRAQ